MSAASFPILDHLDSTYPNYSGNLLQQTSRKDLSRYLRSLREASGWSLGEASRKAGIPKTTLWNWESPSSTVIPRNWETIEKLLDLYWKHIEMRLASLRPFVMGDLRISDKSNERRLLQNCYVDAGGTIPFSADTSTSHRFSADIR